MTDSRTKYFVYDEYTAHLNNMASHASNTSDLAKLCQRMYIADCICLEGLDLTLAREALNAVCQVLMKYPALRREMHYFGTLAGFRKHKDRLFAFLYPDADEKARTDMKSLTDQTANETTSVFKNGGLALAYFSGVSDYRFCGIILDEEDFDEQKILRDLEYSESCGFSPRGCKSVKSVVDHELGHLLDYWVGISASDEFLSFSRALNPFEVSTSLSKYSVMGGRIAPAEVIAEGFSESRNNQAPRRLAREIAQIIENGYARKLKEVELKNKIDNMLWE